MHATKGYLLALLASVGCTSELEPPVETTAAAVIVQRDCASIHAVLIAQAEGLGNCRRQTIASPPASDLGAGCAGMTADDCAQEHFDHPNLYVDPTGSGSFRLHYLPLTSMLRCADGTRPHYYFSPGADATRWIVYQNGGSGKCARRSDRLGNYIEAGPACFDKFAADDGNTGFGRKVRWEGAGILDGGNANVDFRTWNRVWIPSCSNDQYQGTADHPSELVNVTGNKQWNAPLYSHGFSIVTEVIDDLANGGVSMDLSDAELVMLYGSSGGASGLQMTLDAKADHVHTVSSARVVGLLDARSEPNLAGAEGLFDAHTCSSVYEADCPNTYNAPEVGTDVGAGFQFDSSAYLPADPIACPGCGTARTSVDWWGTPLDKSCLFAHPTDDWRCYDGYHLMYNDTSTAVFQSTSLRDHNQYNNPIEYVTVAEGDSVTFQSLEVAPNCGDLPRERVIGQLEAYWTFRDGAGGAHGESHGAGPIGIWAIDWADHEITKESGIFNDAALDGVTLSAALLDWAVNETPIYLIDAPGHATRTANPTIAEKINTCP